MWFASKVTFKQPILHWVTDCAMSLKYKYMHIRATATELAMCLGFIYNGRQREDLHPVETTFGWELCASKVWFNCAWLTLGSKEVDKQECLWLPNTMARNVPCSCCSSFARSTSAHLSTRKSTENAIWWGSWRSRECPRALSQHSCACPIARVEWTRARPQSHPALSLITGSFRCDSNWIQITDPRSSDVCPERPILTGLFYYFVYLVEQ